jgi:alcohol dehydrogenase class IV
VKPSLQCQLGAVDAIAVALLEVPMGGSRRIGHQLSPLGVGHRETSCILPPAMCKFNARVNEKQQQKVLDILWSEPSIKAILEKRKLEQGKTDLGDALDAVLRDLGMPRSLGDFGFGRENLDGLGEESLSDRYCKTNAIPLERKKQLMEILKKVFD